MTFCKFLGYFQANFWEIFLGGLATLGLKKRWILNGVGGGKRSKFFPMSNFQTCIFFQNFWATFMKKSLKMQNKLKNICSAKHTDVANFATRSVAKGSENARTTSQIFRGPTKKNFSQIQWKLTELEQFGKVTLKIDHEKSYPRNGPREKLP